MYKGKVADKETRDLRKKCHRLFDRLWKSGEYKRSYLYEHLQKKMKMTRKQAHIGKFNKQQCLKLLSMLEKKYMFYCDPCKDKYNYPELIHKSLGTCEICKQQAICNDVPTSQLPKNEKVDAHTSKLLSNLKLELTVSPLEDSQKLEKLGVSQQTIFSWFYHQESECYWVSVRGDVSLTNQGGDELCSAYTLTEMSKLMAPVKQTDFIKAYLEVMALPDDIFETEEHRAMMAYNIISQPEITAKMLIYFIENKYVFVA